MVDRPKLYAQFEGDEIDGKVYSLGDEISPSVDFGTRTYLIGLGRIGAHPPTVAAVIPSPGKALADMGRDELEATARSMVDLSGYDDDQLRDEIDRRRRAEAEHAEEQGKAPLTPPAPTPDNSAPGQPAPGSLSSAISEGDEETKPEGYDVLKDKPLGSMTTAQLNTVADAEGIAFDENVKTNADRAAVIQAKRDEAVAAEKAADAPTA
jgi:hypothetical protein